MTDTFVDRAVQTSFGGRRSAALVTVLGASAVTVVGEVDIAAASDVRSALASASGPELVLDMSSVSFIDVAGLNELIDVARQGRSVTIRSASPCVRRLVDLLELGDVLGLDRCRHVDDATLTTEPAPSRRRAQVQLRGQATDRPPERQRR